MNPSLQHERAPNANEGLSATVTVAVHGVALVGLWVMAQHNYLLFHSLVEVFSVVISSALLFLAWNSRGITSDRSLLFLGISYASVGFLDLIHTLAFVGMGVFDTAGFPANQLWIGARVVESLSMLWFTTVIRRDQSFREFRLLGFYGAVVGVVLWLVFSGRFPPCFIEGVGQTTFKIVSEYVVCLIFGASIFFAFRKRDTYHPEVFRYLIASMAFTIAGELAFTVYTDNYGLSNMVGHYCKLISFYMIYLSVIQTSLRHPLETLFKDLSDRERQLRELVATRDRLFSIIAHDLRGPLGALCQVSEYLIQDYESLDEASMKEFAQSIHESSNYSFTLLENLLGWARSQTGRIQYRPENLLLATVVDDAIGLLNAIAVRKRVRLVGLVDPHLTVSADPDMLRTIVRNLLSNAVKFSFADGTVRIEARDHGEKIELKVADEGCGMKPEDRERILSTTVPVTTPGTQMEPGTGLGLMLCREFISRHGSHLMVESQPGRGTCFTFLLVKPLL